MKTTSTIKKIKSNVTAFDCWQAAKILGTTESRLAEKARQAGLNPGLKYPLAKWQRFAD
jgi:hypothetical protein